MVTSSSLSSNDNAVSDSSMLSTALSYFATGSETATMLWYCLNLNKLGVLRLNRPIHIQCSFFNLSEKIE